MKIWTFIHIPRLGLNPYIFILAVLLTVGSLFVLITYAPVYLIYSDTPAKVDAIILFVGPDLNARKEKAFELMKSGYATYLLTPAYKQTQKLTDNGDILPLSEQDIKSNTAYVKEARKGNRRFRILENTHIEILYAKQMMDRLNFKSAIFVSNPFHMRRIKLIANKVFKSADYNILFVHGQHSNSDSHSSWNSVDELRLVFYGYLKIAWFLLYAPFCG